MPEQDDDPADAVPEVSAEPPISQIGICGSSAAIASCAAMPSILKPSRR